MWDISGSGLSFDDIGKAKLLFFIIRVFIFAILIIISIQHENLAPVTPDFIAFKPVFVVVLHLCVVLCLSL